MSLLTWLTGYDEANAAKAEQADAQLRMLNAARAADLGDSWAQQVEANYKSQNAIGISAQKEEINAAFGEGLADGAKNITGFVSGAFRFVGKALGAVLLGIPVWAWLAALVALWVYLGTPGLQTLKKKLPA